MAASAWSDPTCKRGYYGRGGAIPSVIVDPVKIPGG